MVGILVSYWGPAFFQGRAVSFRECNWKGPTLPGGGLESFEAFLAPNALHLRQGKPFVGWEVRSWDSILAMDSLW